MHTYDEKKKKQPQQRPLLLNRYEKGELLGVGNFACVYHARHISTGDEVAIKVVEKSKIFKSELSKEHIEREIAVLYRLRHPNIVRLFEVMASKTKIYIVMEYVRGGDLLHKLSTDGALSEAVGRKFFQQLISAVKFCHARGVYHRDIKLENLLVDEKGDLKLSDFGLSAVAEQKRAAALFSTMCGTPAYVAPELLAHRAYDAARADVWSCGVVLFGLQAGYLPFRDINGKAMGHRIRKGEVRYPKSFSSDLTGLLHRIFVPDPTKRITISEIMETSWFRKDFREVKLYDRCSSLDNIEYEHTPGSSFDSSPAARRLTKLNAFDIISFSPWLKLSGMFEDGGCERWYTSSAEVLEIVSRLEEIAGSVGFTVQTKDFVVSIEGREKEEEEPLWIVVEVSELTPDVAVIVATKKGGDREEYEEFCNNKLSPGLQSLKGNTSLENAACGVH
ncbi:CBL-interacting serine/threonine-protein kinase 12-like [Ananas comosus]|uniref:non-specific serine/threonine protein kinase n=1 Tax=Ananas comosus TaxID=4615 RepID=A0A6P5EXQ1_ANACO|nr:CBL-interacting serine/threonine-protein kinase 12-like [Ananas comosus]